MVLKWKKSVDSWYHASFNNDESLHVRLNSDFLVNGVPAGKLPKEIKEHLLYERYFKNKTDFEVFQSKNSGEFIAKDFSFLLIDNELIIKNKIDDFNYRQLLPQALFESNFPIAFCENYSHWLVQEKNEIEFHSRTFNENLKDNHRVYFIYDLNQHTLKDCSSGKHLVSIHSKTFIELESKFTQKLESMEYVHMYVESRTNSKQNKTKSCNLIRIELPRMKLHFYLDEKLNILSKEYTGFKVNKNLNIETLLGLKKFIVLSEEENFYDEKPKTQIIIPNGELKIGKTKENFKIVDISCEVPKLPTFFTYEIDWRLRRLKASESIEAWLYLALLHASTSQVLPDPFLQMTGTEMSLEILQSGYVWSCIPYSLQAKEMLNKISKFSPLRRFYPKHKRVMQHVSWPELIPSMNAHEGFKFITNKLLIDSEPQPETNCFLESRAFNKTDKYQNRSAQLKPDYKIFIEKSLSTRVTMAMNYDFIQNLRTYKNEYFNKTLNLLNFIFSKEVNSLTFNLSDELVKSISITNWDQIANNLKENWIVLYKFSLNHSFENNLKLKMILSLIAYLDKKIPLAILSFFNFVSENNELFKVVQIPKIYENYTDLNCDKKEAILKILEKNFIKNLRYQKIHQKSFLFMEHEYNLDKIKQLKIAENIICKYQNIYEEFRIESLRQGNIFFF